MTRKRLTLAVARAELGARGIVLTRTAEGEYRVNFKGGAESTAYYTNDLDDAVATGADMAARVRGNPRETAQRTDVKSFVYKTGAARWLRSWRAATGYGGSVIRAGGRGRNRSWLVYYDVPRGELPEAARKLLAAGGFRSNPVQHEGDERPGARRRRSSRAGGKFSPLPEMDAFIRKHLAAWLKENRPRGHATAARAAIMRAVRSDPKLLQSHSWPELERMGATLDNPSGRELAGMAPVRHALQLEPSGAHFYARCPCGWEAGARGTKAQARASFARHKKAALKKAAPRKRTRSNPAAWSGHASVRGGELFSRRVLEVKYEHVDDPAHVARRHPFGPGVFMYALKDGSVLIRHREYPRERVWADLPDKGRR